MAHEPARAFQQAFRIVYLGATKETDVDVIPESIDVAKCRITNARSGMAVMQ